MAEIILEVSDEVAERFDSLDERNKDAFAKFIEVFLEGTRSQ